MDPKSFKAYPLHAIGDDFMRLKHLTRLSAFLLPNLYPEEDIRAPEEFLKSLERPHAVKPYITVYYQDSAPCNLPAAAIVAYLFKSPRGNIGFVKHIAIHPDYSEAETRDFIALQLIDHISAIANDASRDGGNYRGTFIEAHINKQGEIAPGEDLLETIGAQLVYLGGYVVPTPASWVNDTEHSLYIANYNRPEPTNAHDLELFLHLYAMHNNYSLTHSYPAIEAMMTRASEMSLEGDIPILAREQDRGTRKFIETAGLWAALPPHPNKGPETPGGSGPA